MKQFGGLFQSADWKMEKHVPVIECADKVKASENVEVTGVMELENRCIIKQILLPREDMKYGCSVGVFEEHSILFRSGPC